jgi:tRNA-splicing endonuclease subunit Sen54
MQCFWENGVPMDLAGVYAACLALAGGAERYAVYAYLRRAGYALRRAPEWEGVTKNGKGVFGWLWENGMFLDGFLKTFKEMGFGGNKPIVKRGVYRSYADIYKKLEVIPRYVAPSPKLKQRFVSDPSETEAPFRLCFHVWKPVGIFKKSAPRAPDFRIAVVEYFAPSHSYILQLIFLQCSHNHLPNSHANIRPL